MEITLRKSMVRDIPKIYHLLTEFGREGLLLPRSLSELYDVIRDFYVAFPEGDEEKLLGTCALHVCWEDLGEIRSLAVAKHHQGHDLGQRLVETCMDEARKIGLTRLFALTYIPKYFERFDFRLIDKSQLPQKIWADCFKCVKFPECDEVAVARDL